MSDMFSMLSIFSNLMLVVLCVYMLANKYYIFIGLLITGLLGILLELDWMVTLDTLDIRNILWNTINVIRTCYFFYLLFLLKTKNHCDY